MNQLRQATISPQPFALILKTTHGKGVNFDKTGGGGMFEISGFDTSGSVKLKRVSLPAALKKARELIEDGCWDVHVIDPEGRIYSSFEQEVA
jgi:hypothetical protein